MKILCNREELSQKLSIVSKVATAKGTLHVLGGIKLTASGFAAGDGMLTMEATDLEITLRATISSQTGQKIKVLEEGTAVVGGKLFTEAIKKLSGLDVLITIDDRTSLIESGKTKCSLSVFPPEEFPETIKESETMENDESFETHADELKEAVTKTIYATLKEDSRPFTTGIYFELEDNSLRMIGTDINRLAIYSMPISNNTLGNSAFLVPVKALREIVAVYGKNERLKIGTDRTKIMVQSIGNDVTDPGIIFSARLLEGQYPKYTNIIPKDFEGEFKVNRHGFVGALERVQLVSNTVIMLIKDDVIRISGREAGKGSVVDELEIVEKSGTDLTIGFNIRFLLDYLKTIDNDATGFKYTVGMKPVVFENAEGAKTNTYLAMPVKLAETEIAGINMDKDAA
jgi:DNA polymerase-3 subunit beta